MRNKGRLRIVLLSCWLLSGCVGGDGEYAKHMAEADKAMENLDVETAIEEYRKIAEMAPGKFVYGEGRIVIVRQLLEDAENLKQKLGDLKSRAEKVKQALAELDMRKAKAKEIAQVYHELNDVHSALEQFPAAGLYKELGDLHNKFANDVKSGKVDPLKKEIEHHIGKLAFDTAENNVTALRELEDGMSNIVGNAAADYSAKIKSEKAKYIDLPVTYNQRNITLLENDAGKITFLGEGVKNNQLALIYKYEGAVRYAAKELPPKIQAVFTDGKSVTSDKLTLRHYPDYAIGYQFISDIPTKTLARLDYRFGLQPKEEYTKVDIGAAGVKETLKEVLALPDKELQSSIKATNGQITLEIGKVKISANSVEIQGKMTASADTKLKEKAVLYVPTLDTYRDYTMNQDLFAGIAKDIKVTFGLNGRLPNDAKYLKLHMAGIQTNIDLASGGEYKPDKELLAQQIMIPDKDTQIWERFNGWDRKFLEDASGNIYADGIGFTGANSWVKEPSVSLSMSGEFKRLTAKVGVDKTTVGEDFGTSDFKVIGDGRLLKTISFGSSAPATLDLDLYVSGIRTLQFAAVQNPKAHNDAQTLIIGNGVLTP
ncbi:hypothetical protein FE783_26580 [Paenibacillus mesophilus]|uniref:NPCBM/NEW2 domain-containing protein n=1 Tax=Paenibacillus mesophilus TaxID=2582849 RepID=UPI00110E7221|nr:NPCBM/NEW2 domain-containing protein [Paenibacillus mesophilus]TMV46259.1 hypothetical protein FE783_26580 [Paenibacillus mesophilus]